MSKRKNDLLKEQNNKKDAGNNQWTNANLKYYPDERKRQDGPGGNQEVDYEAHKRNSISNRDYRLY